MAKKSPPRKGRRRASRSVVVGAIGLLVAVPTIGYSMYLDTPAGLAGSAQRLMADAAVSMSASVPANPYNTLASQLSAEQAQLDQREATLNAQESAINEQSAPAEDWTFASLALSILLLILVALNFYFDMRRRRPRQDPLAQKFLVDLR